MSSKTVEEAFDAFMDQWRSRPTTGAYIFPPPSKDIFAAGAAHGAAEERELVNALRSGVMTCRSTGAGKEYYVRIDFGELAEAQNLHCVLARIRQRGEK